MKISSRHFWKACTYKEISDILQQLYPGKRGFSLRSVERYCCQHGLTFRIHQTTVNGIVAESVQSVSKIIIVFVCKLLFLFLL